MVRLSLTSGETYLAIAIQMPGHGYGYLLLLEPCLCVCSFNFLLSNHDQDFQHDNQIVIIISDIYPHVHVNAGMQS